jgi:hypothetical protein
MDDDTSQACATTFYLDGDDKAHDHNSEAEIAYLYVMSPSN